MSRYISRVLVPNETVLYETELHWVIYRHGVLLILLGALVGHFADQLVSHLLGPVIGQASARPITYLAMAIIAFGAFHLILAYVRQISTELIITNRRVIAKYGCIATTSFEVMIGRVEGANIDQTVWGRFLDFGTVMVHGTGGGISPIDHIAHPYSFHTALMAAIQTAPKGRDAGKGF